MRIFGINLNLQKPLFISLTSIFGIGQFRAKEICYNLQINPLLRLNTLSIKEQENLINIITKYIEKNYIIESQLKQLIKGNINQFIKLKLYKGFRHLYKLPVHGQRTHTNAKTCKRIWKV